MNMSSKPTTGDYSLSTTLPAKIARRLTSFKKAKRINVNPGRTIVSFSFDDFPKSAADIGAEIIESVGGHACYYACTGLAGTAGTIGELFDQDDLLRLNASGHEIGAHTNTHLDCEAASVEKVLADLQDNLDNLRKMGHHAPVTQFAYPYGATNIALKRALINKVAAARGTIPGVNRRGSDQMQLKAYSLSPDKTTTERAIAAINKAEKEFAWVNIYTHDVRNNPSPYGTTPQILTQLARLARDTGAAILTPSAALAEIDSQH